MKWLPIEMAPAIAKDLAAAIESSYQPPSSRCKLGFGDPEIWAFWLDEKHKVTKYRNE